MKKTLHIKKYWQLNMLSVVLLLLSLIVFTKTTKAQAYPIQAITNKTFLQRIEVGNTFTATSENTTGVNKKGSATNISAKGVEVTFSKIDKSKQYATKLLYGISGIEKKKEVFTIISHGENKEERKKDIEAIYYYITSIDATNYTGVDKGVVVLCNGEVEDFIDGQSTIEKGSYTYWGIKFIDVLKGGNKKKYKNDIFYRNGDNGGIESSTSRYEIGIKEGERDAKMIKGRLGTEGTVKMISHSKGCAYAVGYMKGLKNIDSTIKIEYNIMLAPHQGGSWKFELEGCNLNLGIRHEGDLLSSKLKHHITVSEVMLSEEQIYMGITTEVDVIIKKTERMGERMGEIIGDITVEGMGERIEMIIGEITGEIIRGEMMRNITYLLTKTDDNVDVILEKVKKGATETATATEVATETAIRMRLLKIHSINGFHFEVRAAIKALSSNKNAVRSVKRARKDYWDEEKQEYLEPKEIMYPLNPQVK